MHLCYVYLCLCVCLHLCVFACVYVCVVVGVLSYSLYMFLAGLGVGEHVREGPIRAWFTLDIRVSRS